MTFSDLAVIGAFIGAIVAAMGGIAAFYRAGADRSNVMVDTAETVVGMLREEVARLDGRLDETNTRMGALEVTVGQWESWAERVLTLLDRAIGMLDTANRALIEAEVRRVKDERPTRSRPTPPPPEDRKAATLPAKRSRAPRPD